MFRIVLDERKRREIDPTMAILEECIAEAGKEKDTDKNTEERLRELHRFFQTTTAWYSQVAKLPSSALVKFLSTGDKLLKSIGIGS
jgi:DNA-binding transcriptional regulator GbsR (MarR family)